MRARCSTKQRRPRCALGLPYPSRMPNVNCSVPATIDCVEIDNVRAALERDGYYVAHVAPRRESAADFLLDFARSLGELYVPVDCDPAAPLIRTAPTSKRHAAPFDRPEA